MWQARAQTHQSRKENKTTEAPHRSDTFQVSWQQDADWWSRQWQASAGECDGYLQSRGFRAVGRNDHRPFRSKNWLLFVATVCGYCLWLLFVATVCYCLWLLFVATVCGYCLWLPEGNPPGFSRISPPENPVLSRVTIFRRAARERLGCVSGDSPHTALVGLHLVKAASIEGDRLVVHVDPRAPQLLSVALRNSHFRRRAIVVFHPDPSSREGSESDRVVRLADHV